MIEVTTEDIVVDIVNDIDVSSTGNIDVVVEDNNELDITVAKKEFVITGDNIYVPVLYDDVPQWMKDLVSLSVNQAIEGVSTSNLDQLNSMLAEFATSYVPLNQYTESILDLSNADVSLHALIETLNSTYEDGINSANSQIITLESTKASKDEVVTQVIETINSQLIDGTSDIGATIARLDQAIVSSNQSSALSYQALVASIDSLGDGLAGNAAAINTVGSYVGVVDGVVTGTGLLADVAILQKQNDGIIETTSGTYKVMLNPQDPNTAQLVTTAEPYASWKASETPGSMDKRLAHIGDVYIEYVSNSNGMKEYVASFKFIKTVVDGTSPYATDTEGFTWALVIDQAAQDAYQQALNAYDLADNKRRVFVTTPVLPYDVGDLWIDSTGTYAVVKHWTGSTWLVADRQVTEFANTVYTPTINSLQSQVDAKIEYWFQTTDPKTAWTTAALRLAHNGDVWYNTSSKISQYYSNVTDSWSVISDKDALDAITAAEAARQLADSKVEVRYGTSAQRDATSNSWTAAEKTSNIGDLWIISDAGVDQNKQFRWNGTGWLDIRDNKIIANANAITQLQSDVISEAGLRASGDTAVENTVKAYADNVGAGVETKWAYNSNVNIAGTNYNSGFGIATSLTTGSGLPVGQSEFWVKADKFRLMSADGSMKSSYSPFTVNAGTGDITFNGKVEFSNVNGAPTNTSSSNLIKNSEFQDSVQPWSLGWNPNGSNIDVFTLDKYAHASDWILTGQTKSLTVRQNGRNASTANYDIAIDIYPQGSYYPSSGYSVMSGTTYEFSAYIAAHRCKVSLGIQFFNSSGGAIAGSESAAQVVGTGGKSLDNYTRVYTRVVAPSGSVTALLYLRKFNTDSGYTDSWIWVARPFFGNVDEKSAAPVPYVASDSSNSSINNNNDIFAQKLGYANYSDMVTAANNGQTIINGGYIRTTLLQSDQIIAGGLLANTVLGNTISGSTITGSKIYGAQIEGSIIKASFIDLTSTATLTNWQQYTPANYPSQYAANFAHNNDGSLVVDSLGYVRLMGNTNIITPEISQAAGGTSYTYRTLNPYSIEYFSWGDYKNNKLNRCITSNPSLNISTSKKISYLYLLNFSNFNTTHSCYALFTVHENTYEVTVSVSQGSSAGTELASGSIKKNGVIVQSFSNLHSNANISDTNTSGGVPITISVGCSLGMFGGMSGRVTVESTNTLSTTTQIFYDSIYGIPFKLIQGYTTYGAAGSCDVSVPAITING